MSDNWLRLIPTDPTWLPTPGGEASAIAVLHKLAPESEEVKAITYERIAFIDAGANFEAIYCPQCERQLPVEWWSTAMDTAYSSVVHDLAVVVPCCGSPSSLNDLGYVWPQGFSRWVLEARCPGRSRLASEELALLASALGHQVREIWTHL